jgi:hypothetical protein
LAPEGALPNSRLADDQDDLAGVLDQVLNEFTALLELGCFDVVKGLLASSS